MSKRKPSYEPAKPREILKTGVDNKPSEGLFTIKINNHNVLETDNVEYAKAYMNKHEDNQEKAYLYKDNLLVGEFNKTGLNIYENSNKDAWINVYHIS